LSPTLLVLTLQSTDVTIVCRLNDIRPIDFWPNDEASQQEYVRDKRSSFFPGSVADEKGFITLNPGGILVGRHEVHVAARSGSKYRVRVNHTGLSHPLVYGNKLG
jgi:hypothetical protein